VNGISIGAGLCDLRDILAVVRDVALRSTWKLAHVECAGDDCDVLHASDRGEVLDGARRVDVAERILQTVDGDFVGSVDGTPWIEILAIDSTVFHVFAAESVLDALRARFTDTPELPPDSSRYF